MHAIDIFSHLAQIIFFRRNPNYLFTYQSIHIGMRISATSKSRMHSVRTRVWGIFLRFFQSNINDPRTAPFSTIQANRVSNIKAANPHLCWSNWPVQVNLCQKLLFLHQLTHNMTTECSLNYEVSTWKLQAPNMLCTQIVWFFCFDIQNNLCTQHVLSMFWACNFHVLNL